MRNYYVHPVNHIVKINKIVTIEYMQLKKGVVLPIENHDFYEFVYVDDGTITYSLDGENKTLNSQEMVLCPPNVNHTIFGDKEKNSNIFVICFECNSPYIKLLDRCKIKLKSQEKMMVKSILSEAESTYILPLYDKKKFTLNPNIGGEQAICLYFELLLITLIRNTSGNDSFSPIFSKTKTDSGLFDMIAEYLSQSVYSKIEINDLCKTFNYGKTYISNLFKKISGKTIIEYFNGLKIKEAKRLLKETTYSVSEIADMLSYSDISYFTTQFKKATSLSPNAYRNSIKD